MLIEDFSVSHDDDPLLSMQAVPGHIGLNISPVSNPRFYVRRFVKLTARFGDKFTRFTVKDLTHSYK